MSEGQVVAQGSKKQTAVLALSCLIGLWMIGVTLWSYRGGYEYLCTEFTAITNLLAGTVLIAGVVWYLLRGKRLPSILYFSAMVSLLIVMIISIIFGLNFAHGFQFLHVVNPVLFFLFWLIYVDHSSDRAIHLVLGAITLPLTYLLYAILALDGYYPFLRVDINGVMGVALFVTVTLVAVVIMSWLLVKMNVALRKCKAVTESKYL